MELKFKGGFTAVPNYLLERLIFARLPAGSIHLILLVYRFSFGMHKKSAYLTGAALSKILPINRNRIPYLIKWLTEMNILKGGPARLSKNKHVYAYELSINFDYQNWDVSFDSSKRKLLYDLLDKHGYKFEV